MKLTARAVFAVVLFCFFVSGVAGLIYQVVWARYLALFLGHTSYAVVAVLVAFMGGLALGNAWLGTKADQINRPLAFYGWLEMAIGAYAILFPLYSQACHDAYVWAARTLSPGSPALLLTKFLVSFLTILLPTILMGATFPVLTRFVTRALSELREKVAALYALNSAGAVVGALLADFWLIPGWGLEMTIFIGAALNIIAGAISFYVSQTIGQSEWRKEQTSEPTLPESEEPFNSHDLKLALLAIGISGFVAMLYEVAWTRFLGLVLGSSTHAFSLMLVTFISGIAAGAWVVYRWRKLRRSFNAFGWAELALAGSLFVSMFFYEAVPYWFLKLAALLTRREASYPIYQFLQAAVCFGVMFLPAVCLGMTLPLVSRVATTELARTGQAVGRVFAINTLGTVLGAIVTGLWLLPVMGLARTFAVGVALNAWVGIAVLKRRGWTLNWRIATPLAGAAFIALAGVWFHDTWQRTFSLGLWRNSEPPPSFSAFRQVAQLERLKYHRDGASATVTVVAHQRGDTEQLGLKVNGKADASSYSDVPTQRLLGHLPLLLRPQSKRALVVGFGSGMTCASLLRHPNVRVDAVEISPEVVEAAKHFSEFNDRVFENPKLRVFIEDAKSFLKITAQKYDVIISEPSNPWMAGVAGVFSQEYYQSCLERLEPGGLMAQWVQLYESNDQTLNMMLATFTSVFPFMSVWHTAGGDLVLVGAPQPFAVDMEALQKRYDEPSVKSDLDRTEITRLSVLLSREIISQQNGAFAVPHQTRVHSDYYPALEYLAQKAFFTRSQTTRWREFDETFSPRPTTILGGYLKKVPLTEADYKALGRFYLEYQLPESDVFRSIVIRWQSEHPQSTLAMEMMAQASDRVSTSELEALRNAPLAEFLYQHAERDPEPLRMYASYVMQTYRAHRSVFYVPPSDRLEWLLERLIGTNPANQRAYRLQLAEIAWDHGDDRRCFELAGAALDPDVSKGGQISFAIDPKVPRTVLARMIETFLRSGKLNEAVSLTQQAIQGRYTGRDDMLDLAVRKVQTFANLPVEP